MNKFFYIVFVLLLLAGCAGPVKQSWQNFTAYYNTFYNAQQFYEEGLEKNLNQNPEINPLLPLRAHASPSAAGFTEFSEAIERGASILRSHENSKYVSKALALIGKSYYYRSEFYAAMEKFQELQAVGNSEEVQEATLWQGRTYMELNDISTGINFLEAELEQTAEWNPQLRAEAELVLAQLYVHQENWQLALNYLYDSIVNIEDRNLKARAFFLQGQLFEETGRNEQALFSYSRITEMRTDYDLEFNALRKVAEITRKLGDYDKAQELYTRIERDDKFLDYNDELHYEIARTLQEQGNTSLSLKHYKGVLGDRFQPPSDEVRAKTYYGIAEIYRDDVKDFSLAAAYFDSAANTQSDPDLLPEFYNARELAATFGEYASVKKETAELDSLLYLGSLSAEELDSVLVEIEHARSLEQSRVQERLEERENRSVFVDETDSLVEAAEGAEDGFLNIHNPQKVRDASLQFQAVWGDRPLADDWRRRDQVSGSRFSQPVVLTDGRGSETTDTTTAASLTETIHAGEDLSQIPLSEDEQNEMARRIEELNYRLANIFFLSLDMPDSAKVYYQKVADMSSRDNLITRSRYSLAEIELLEGNRKNALAEAQKLIEYYPNSVYSEKIAERLDIDHTIQSEEPSATDSLYYRLSAGSTESPAEKATELRQLAEESPEPNRPYILFDAAKEYIKAARQTSGNSSGESQWLEAQEKIRQEKQELTALKDSAEVILEDSIPANEEKYWKQIADSVYTEPDFNRPFPFEGAWWDSARSVLGEIEINYSSSDVIPQVRVLRQTLQRPEAKRDEPEIITSSRNNSQKEPPVTACNEMEPAVEMAGTMDSFMTNISFPGWTREITMRGELTYLLTILPDGAVDNYEQESQMDRNGIPQAYEYAIEEYLVFKPTQRENAVECTVDFPVNL